MGDSEMRIARMTWNSEGWIRPSGRTGKSKKSDTYEGTNGFGHEEWLFDFEKLIDGYHYGFLEPINRGYKGYRGKTYHVWLYTIDGSTKERYWVGEIRDLQVLTPEEAQKCMTIYKRCGWLAEMSEALKEKGLPFEKIFEYERDATQLFNIKFRPGDTFLNLPLVTLPKDHPVRKLSRYQLMEFQREYQVSDHFVPDFSFIPPEHFESNESALQTRQLGSLYKTWDVVLWHNVISCRLVRLLRAKFGNENVAPEHPAVARGKIDIVVREPDGLIFYEIKPYTSLRLSIREAIGQLLEYSLWPKNERAKALVIISHHCESSEGQTYVKHIREKFKLPIYYQSYDYEHDTLSERF